MLKLSLLFCVVAGSLAQVPGIGKCPAAETVPDFDVEKYLGKWYEQKRFFAIFEIGGKCVTANYTLNDEGNVRVINSQVNVFTGNRNSIEGVAKVPNPDEPGKLSVKFPPAPVDGSYWVLDTDYDTYAAVWSCQNLLIANTQFAWLLTREQNPPEHVITKALSAFEKYGINVNLFETTDQINCDQTADQ